MPRSSTTFTNIRQRMINPSPAALRRRNKHGLTPKQVEVVNHLAEGTSDEDIQYIMRIRSSTLYTHVDCILTTLKLPSKRKLIVWGIRNGYGEHNIEPAQHEQRLKYIQRSATSHG